MSRIVESLYEKYGITLNEEDYEISNKGYTKADRKKVKKLLSTKKGEACGDKKELDEAINPELMTIYDEFDFEDDELPKVRKWLKDDYDVDLVSAKTNNHGTKDVVLQGTKENLLKSYLDEYDIEDVKDWHPELFESLKESKLKEALDSNNKNFYIDFFTKFIFIDPKMTPELAIKTLLLGIVKDHGVDALNPYFGLYVDNQGKVGEAGKTYDLLELADLIREKFNMNDVDEIIEFIRDNLDSEMFGIGKKNPMFTQLGVHNRIKKEYAEVDESLNEDANNDDDFHTYLENRIDELFADLENAGVSEADIRDAISYYISFI